MKIYKITFSDGSYTYFRQKTKIKDIRLLPYQYRKLKELGVGKEVYSKFKSYEECDRYIRSLDPNWGKEDKTVEKQEQYKPKNKVSSSTPLKLYKPKPYEFKKIFDTAKKSVNPSEAWRVSSDYSGEDYTGMDVYATSGGSTFALHDGDIVSVCKNTNDKNVRGKQLIEQAVKLGGNRLDAFSGIYSFYTKCGFEPVCRIKFNPEYAPEGWDSDVDDEEDIVFFRYTGKISDTPYEEAAENIPIIEDSETESAYDRAVQYRKSVMEKTE